MTESRSLEAHKLFHEARVKFDYFITGAAAVVLGFTLKEFAPRAGGFASWLLPLSWALLLIATGSGMLALSYFVEVQRLGIRFHEQRDAAGAIRSQLLESSSGVIVDVHTGGRIDEENADSILRVYATNQTTIQDFVDKVATRELWAGRIRDMSLLTALGALSLWRWINF